MTRYSHRNFVAFALLVFSSHLLAQVDTTPPALVNFSFSPSAIDTTTGPRSVTVTATITDNLAGVYPCPAWMYFFSPTGKQYRFTYLCRISGTPLNGVYEGSVSFPQFTESGIWKADNLYMTDVPGNSAFLRTANLHSLVFPTDLSVTSTPDLTPPQVTAFTLSPSGGQPHT